MLIYYLIIRRGGQRRTRTVFLFFYFEKREKWSSKRSYFSTLIFLRKTGRKTFRKIFSSIFCVQLSCNVWTNSMFSFKCSIENSKISKKRQSKKYSLFWYLYRIHWKWICVILFFKILFLFKWTQNIRTPSAPSQ